MPNKNNEFYYSYSKFDGMLEILKSYFQAGLIEVWNVGDAFEVLNAF